MADVARSLRDGSCRNMTCVQESKIDNLRVFFALSLEFAAAEDGDDFCELFSLTPLLVCTFTVRLG